MMKKTSRGQTRAKDKMKVSALTCLNGPGRSPHTPKPSAGGGVSGTLPGDEDIHWFVGVALAVPLILCLFVALASGTFQTTIMHL